MGHTNIMIDKMEKYISIIGNICVKFDKPKDHSTIKFVMKSYNRIFEKMLL